jgi:predicted transporter
MLLSIIKPLPLIFTAVATFGVLVHDTQIDRATTVAIALPTAFATFVAIDSVIKSSEQHVHVERVSMPSNLASLRATLPRIQPRDDDRRYIQTKKLNFGMTDSTQLWPST